MLTNSLRSLVCVQLSELLSISINAPSSSCLYPTSKIQKGPVIAYESTDLAGEGIGLGVPVAKFDHRVFFPGKVFVVEKINGPYLREWIVDYELNLEERLMLKSGKIIRSNRVYSLIERFAKLHKAISVSRGLIECANSLLRRLWGLRTTFEMIPSSGNVRVSYLINSTEKELHISVDASRLKTECNEMILLNEQDGHFFDRYYDANGLALVGKEIGTWEKTTATWLTLVDSHHNVALHFRNITGATVYRGREVVPRRLSWAGIAYATAPPCTNFEYDVSIQEGP